MRFTMSVDMDGAAFDDSVDDAGLELLRIMGKASGRVRDGEREGTLLDTNGNTVGHWMIGNSPDGYRAQEIARVLDAGPADGEDFYRLQVSGKTSSRHLNACHEELRDIADTLS